VLTSVYRAPRAYHDFKYSTWPHRSWQRQVPEMLDMSSTFTQLITWEDFDVEASSTEFVGRVMGRKEIKQNA